MSSHISVLCHQNDIGLQRINDQLVANIKFKYITTILTILLLSVATILCKDSIMLF